MARKKLEYIFYNPNTEKETLKCLSTLVVNALKNEMEKRPTSIDCKDDSNIQTAS